MSSLRNCPFCGNTAVTEQFGFHTVECRECGAEATTDTWNSRADDWVSVEERLPEKQRDVLVLLTDNEIRVSRRVEDIPYNAGNRVWQAAEKSSNFFYEDYTITHWRPLPEPPEEPPQEKCVCCDIAPPSRWRFCPWCGRELG